MLGRGGRDGHFLAQLAHVDVGHGRRVVAVEDACNLLEGGAFGLDVDEVNEEELEKVP
jgi:hypothetical protein